MSDPSQCPNCFAELTGEYCPGCGQKRIHPEELSPRHFFGEIASEVANLNLKFKTLRSLISLFRPGFLTTEYFAGRRERYLSPLKLYLVCAAVCFAAASFGGYNLKAEMAQDPSRDLMKQVSARMAERGIDRELFMQRFDLRVQTVFTVGMSAAVIAFALVLRALFRGKMLPYGAHLLFALYFVSFLYLINPGIAGTIQVFGLSSWQAFVFNYCLIAVYVILAIKHVYYESTGLILLKSGIFIIVTFVILAIANIGAILITLRLV